MNRLDARGHPAPCPSPGAGEGATPTAGDGNQAGGGPRSSAGQARAGGRAVGLLPARGSRGLRPTHRPPALLPVPSLVRNAATLQLRVVAIPHLANRFSDPGPHSPQLRSSPHLPSDSSLPDWLSRDLMPISQSPPLARPTLTNERLAGARGRAQERRGPKACLLPGQSGLPFPVFVRTRGAQ